MKFDLPDNVEILKRTPATLNAMLLGLPGTWAQHREREDSWSAFDVVGHLICGEKTDWIPRARIILKHGEAKPFTPFDRNAQFWDSKGKSLETLLDEFAAVRKANLEELEAMALNASDLNRRGTHPELGPVTLGQLLATWTSHDLCHISQIARVMCRRNKPFSGPWNHPDYMPIFQ